MHKKKGFIIGIILVILIVMIKSQNDVEETGVSDYKLYEPTHYTKYGKGGIMNDGFKTIEGDYLYVNALDAEAQKGFGYHDDKSYLINASNISDKLKAVIYFPQSNIIPTFGKHKSMNIVLASTLNETKDPYDSPVYIGYYDGTCEYPEEFNYVKSKSKCNQYLQDTLNFAGYDSVDEMLEDIFGDYITKDPDKSEVSN